MIQQDVQSRVDAYRGNPQALMQKYAVSQELLDLLALQKINQEKQSAVRQMQMQMGAQGNPPPVAQQLEKETLDLTKQEMTQQPPPAAQDPRMQGGVATLPTPGGQFAQGGVVGYAGGGDVAEDDGPSALRLLVPAALAGSASAMTQLNKLAPGLGYTSGRELATAMARSLKLPGVPGLPAGTLAKAGVAGLLGSTALDVAGTETEDYRKRFGMETDDPSLLGDLAARGLGAASDLGNAMTIGYAGKFFRDKQEKKSPAGTGTSARGDTSAADMTKPGTIASNMKRMSPEWESQMAVAAAAGMLEPQEKPLWDAYTKRFPDAGQSQKQAPMPQVSTQPGDSQNRTPTAGAAPGEKPTASMPTGPASDIEAATDQAIKGMINTDPAKAGQEARAGIESLMAPRQALADERLAGLADLEKQYAALQSEREAGLIDERPQWQQWLQNAALSASKSGKGMQAMIEGDVETRKQQGARKQALTDSRMKNLETLRALRDQGFTAKEAKLQMGERAYDAAKAAEKDAKQVQVKGVEAGVQRSGQLVNERNSERTLEGYLSRVAASGAAGSKDFTPERLNAVRDDVNKALSDWAKTPEGFVATTKNPQAVEQKKAELYAEYIRGMVATGQVSSESAQRVLESMGAQAAKPAANTPGAAVPMTRSDAEALIQRNLPK